MNTKQIDVDGAVVYWSAGPTQRELLIARLSVLGLTENVPDQRTDAACLKAAMRDYCDAKSQRRRGKDKLLQPRKKQKANGFEVLDVERGEDGNDYRMDFAAKVTDLGAIVVTRGYADAAELRRAFEQHKGQLTGAAVGQFLVGVLAKLGGIALRPSGGVYWIPGSVVRDWEAVANVLEECAAEGGKNAVYCITHQFNERSVRAVKDAIVDEITAASDALVEDIRENDMGEEALTRRQVVAAGLHARVSQYERILGEALTTLHAAIQTAEEAASAAISLQAVEEQFAGIL